MFSPRNLRIGLVLYLALTVVGTLALLSGRGLALGTMFFIAASAGLTIIGVMWLGSQENLSEHTEHSRAVEVWQEREQRVQAARQSLVMVSDGGDSSVVAGAGSATEDDAEARRQAALARKAARASKSTSGE